MRRVALVGCLTILAAAFDGEAAVKVGDAPPISVALVSGDTLDFSELRGKVVLLDFWATWCAPCEKSLPYYAELSQALKDRGLVVVAVSVDSDVALVRKYLKDRPMPFPVAIDADHKLVERFEPSSMPTAFVFDRDGKVRLVHEGFRLEDRDALRKEIESLLGAAP